MTAKYVTQWVHGRQELTIPYSTLKNTVPIMIDIDAVQSDPSETTNSLNTGPYSSVRTFISYTGAVTAANITLWILNGRTGNWHRALSTADLDILDPVGIASDIREWTIGRDVDFTFRLSQLTITDGQVGTISVDVTGVGD